MAFICAIIAIYHCRSGSAIFLAVSLGYHLDHHPFLLHYPFSCHEFGHVGFIYSSMNATRSVGRGY